MGGPGIIYHDRHLTMDPRRHEVRVGDSVVDLTITEWDLLAVFIQNSGRVIAPKELWHALRGDLAYVGADIIKWHIKNLRGKLGFTLNAPIVTVRGVGYRYDTQIVVQAPRG